VTDIGRILRLEARATALFLAVPVLAAIGLATAWPALIPGVGYWDNTVSAVAGSVRTLGPACAALAAWTALRDDPSLGYLRGLTVRSPATVPLLDLSLLACVALPAYAIVTVVVFVKTMMHQEAGHLGVLGIALGAAVLMTHVTAGYLAGRLFPHMVTVPAVGVAGYLWSIAGPGEGTSWAGLPTAAAIERVDVFAAVDDGLFLARLLWSLGLCVLLVAGYLMWLTRHLWLVVPLGLALGAAAAGVARIQTYDTPVTTASFAYACRSWPIRVCVHPALRPALRSLGTAVTPLAARLSGTQGEFTELTQRSEGPMAMPGAAGTPGAGHGGPADPRAVYVRIDDLSAGFERRALRQIVAALLDPTWCGTGRREPGADYTGLVSAWLLDQRPPRIADTAAAAVFARYDEDDRRAWLRTHYGRFRSCRLTAADFQAFSVTGVRHRVFAAAWPKVRPGPRHRAGLDADRA
jgi:hypothetical protein